MKRYAYCLTEGTEGIAAPPEKLQGIAGAQIQIFQAENFSLLVSDFSGDVVPLDRANVLVHAAVVRSVLDRTTPLPFRFGMLVSEEQLRSFLNARREAIAASLALVRGRVEMNVKIIADLKDQLPGNEDSQQKPGTAFLAGKRREILGSEARAAEAKNVAGWLEDLVSATVRETRINRIVTDKLLVAAAHLVERASVAEYRDRLKTGRLERPELKFLVSGPWPPYSFANIELEFHKPFGVS
jgi:hypothetical protein